MSKEIKRSLPKVVIDVIEPIVEKYRDAITIKKSNDTLIRIEDNKDSSFYFTIKKREHSSGSLRNLIEYKPSDEKMDAYSTYASEEQLSSYLTKWCERIKFYQKKSILDDPILNAYRKDIEDEFSKIELVDEDANFTPFNVCQQRILISFFNELNTRLDESKNEIEEDEYEDIKEEVSKAKTFISKETKQQGLDRISKIISICRRASFDLGEKCTDAFIKALFSEAGKMAFKAIRDHWDEISGYVKHLLP